MCVSGGCPDQEETNTRGTSLPSFSFFFYGKIAPLLLRTPRGAIFHQDCLWAPGCVVQGYYCKHQVPRSVYVFGYVAGTGTDIWCRYWNNAWYHQFLVPVSGASQCYGIERARGQVMVQYDHNVALRASIVFDVQDRKCVNRSILKNMV